ncbi:BTAD domain-containing putative transcriptional regulator [Dactylosporangium sp. CA-092794]|uniref:AfsR/SARP family transcriptional regulator n=1 Tax=Dactylosporangium sp. CA-092794 TaxID=3239929 RepID=UPI003D8EA654
MTDWVKSDMDRRSVRFGVLGPLTLALDGEPAHIGGPQVRIVLARLLVDAPHRVSVSALVDELWAHFPPADADRTARTYVSRLRRTLRKAAPPDVEDLLVTLPGGYELRAGTGAVDAARFEELAAAGHRALDQGAPAVAVRLLGEALALWRGDAYAEFADSPTLLAEGTRLDRLRLAAVEDHMSALLATGSDEVAVDNLEALARAYPLRERLWGQLMTALYRSGRQAEALAAFRDARAALIDGHGVEPSPDLIDIHRKILNHDPSLTRPVRVVNLAAPVPVPAQLPGAVHDFVGRRRELSDLDGLLDHRAGGAVVAALSGTAGVGKTALALRWAHRAVDQFPDGQLYVDLRGFAPAGAVLDPAAALHWFLEAFGIPAERIPSDVEARAALYRTVLAGKRVLVVIDNARDSDHARPLLPGSAGAVAVVTSRSSLAGLVATGARRRVLGALSRDEARELLARRLGAERVAVEAAAAEAVIARCARLPLALAIASSRTDATLTQLAASFQDSAPDPFEVPDDATGITGAFSWSCDALSEPAARLLRVLGYQSDPRLTETLAAYLLGVARPQARAAIEELVEANLLAEERPGYYACHDLLRQYAATCSLGGSRSAE